MSKSLLWVGATFLLFTILLLLGRLTKEHYEMKNAPNAMMQTEAKASTDNTSNKDLTGQQLVAKLGCTNCHGSDLSGTKMAPNIHKVKQYWSRQSLINYLRNPSSYMSTSRFEAYRAKYPNTVMPAFNNINVKDLGKVADYVLSLQK